MSPLDEFAERFERPQSAWTKEQWKQAAIELASRLDSTNRTPAKRGRPRHHDARYVKGENGKVTISKKSNYAALAWQVEQRMEQAEAGGRPVTVKRAVFEELVEAIRRHNTAPADQRGERNGEIGEHRANDMLKTAYTEVRKLLKKWGEEPPKVGSAGVTKDSKDMNIRESVEDFSKRNKVNLGKRKRH